MTSTECSPLAGEMSNDLPAIQIVAIHLQPIGAAIRFWVQLKEHSYGSAGDVQWLPMEVPLRAYSTPCGSIRYDSRFNVFFFSFLLFNVASAICVDISRSFIQIHIFEMLKRCSTFHLSRAIFVSFIKYYHRYCILRVCYIFSGIIYILLIFALLLSP